MRIATVHQRASLIVGAGAVDIHEASGGRFGPGAADLDERRAGFVDWAAAATLPGPEPYAPDSLGSPSPTPRQVCEVTSYIEGVGEMRHRFVAGPHR